MYFSAAHRLPYCCSNSSYAGANNEGPVRFHGSKVERKTGLILPTAVFIRLNTTVGNCAVHLCTMETPNAPQYTFVQLGKNWIRIDLQRISHIESFGDYVRWYETGNQHNKSSSSKLTETRLSQLSEQLEPYGFVRVHRRYAVNIRAVEKFDGESLQMESIVIPVGRTRRQHVLARLRSFGLRDDHQTVRASHPIQVVRSSRQESG